MMYKVGDRVKLKGVPGVIWTSAMHYFLNRAVTINYIDNTNRFGIEERTPSRPFDSWIFEVSDIAGFEEPELQKEREEPLKEELKKAIYSQEKVTEIAKGVFGEERVVSSKISATRFDIIIHFPEIEISNSEGRSHIIRDLFVRIGVTISDLYSSFKAFLDISGMRTTFTLGEISNEYAHSHLSGGVDNFTSFCLGSGDLTVVMSNLQMSLSEEDWLLFFYSLDRYVRWESIEGGPYHHIDEIGFKKDIDMKKISTELANIIDKAPVEIWGLVDSLVLNDNHPSFRKFFDANSSIKNMDSYTAEDIEKAVERYKEGLSPTPLKFGKKEIVRKITTEDVAPTLDSMFVSPEVLNEYKVLINNELKTFSKRLEYERRKQDGKVVIEF